MTRSNPSRPGVRTTLAAFAFLAPFGLAHAGELNLKAIGEHFPDTVAAPQARVDMSRYELLNLSAIGEKIYVLKPGAQGPMREAAATEQEDAKWRAEIRTLNRQIWPFGHFQ